MNTTRSLFMSIVIVVLLSINAISFANPFHRFPQSQVFNHANNVGIPDPHCPIIELYENWVNDYVKPHPDAAFNGALIVEGEITGSLDDNGPDWVGIKGISASEHTGYGMIISALMAGNEEYRRKKPCIITSTQPTLTPKDIFEGLTDLYEKLYGVCGGVRSSRMTWSIPETRENSSNKELHACSASDGDMDIAYAFLLADKQWGSGGKYNYLELATTLIKDIEKTNLRNDGLILVGDWPKGVTGYEKHTRTSDWMLGHFPEFKAITGNTIWDDARTKIFTLTNDLKVSTGFTTGLLPDFLADEAPPRPVGPIYLCEPFPTEVYSENAARVPWRFAADWLLNRNTDSGAINFQTASFITGAIATWDDVKNSYNLDGTVFNWAGVGSIPDTDPETGKDCTHVIDAAKKADMVANTGHNYGMHFAAPFITATTTSALHQVDLDDGYIHLINKPKSNYFGDSLRVLSMLLVAGDWWTPTRGFVTTDVWNRTQDVFDNSLQTAINNANDGDWIVVGSDTVSTTNILVDKNDLYIEGQDTGSGMPSISNSTGTAITIDGGVSGVVIDGFNISDANFGIVNNGDGTKIINNVFENIYVDGIQDYGDGGEISGNEFNDIWVSAIYSHKSSASELLIKRNKFRRNYYDAYLEGGTIGKVYNNTVFNGDFGFWFDDTSGVSEVKNNIFMWKYQPVGQWGWPSIDFDSNLLYQNTFDWLPSGYWDSNLVIANPGLDGDLVPSTNNAIDNGITIPGVIEVADSEPDIGAVEVQESNDGNGGSSLPNGQWINDSLGPHEEKLYSLNADSSDVQLIAELSASTSNYLDLYGKNGSEPTTSSYDFKADLIRGYPLYLRETVNSPGSGTWQFLVKNRSSSTRAYDLRVTIH